MRSIKHRLRWTDFRNQICRSPSTLLDSRKTTCKTTYGRVFALIIHKLPDIILERKDVDPTAPFACTNGIAFEVSRKNLYKVTGLFFQFVSTKKH